MRFGANGTQRLDGDVMLVGDVRLVGAEMLVGAEISGRGCRPHLGATLPTEVQ